MKGLLCGLNNSIFFFEKQALNITGLDCTGSREILYQKLLSEAQLGPHSNGESPASGNHNLLSWELELVEKNQQKADPLPSYYQRFNLSTLKLPRYWPYENLAEKINTFPDASFDFIIIGGRSRVACCLNAISKIKPGGFLVLMSSQRKRYKLAKKILKDWPRVDTTDGLEDISFWFKPS